jgi:phosphoribosylformylglycinamidine cyclo-ligase
MYAPGDYDLAGFCVGIAEKEALITPDRVQPGDVLIGLASSGPHSNGYSLIRKVLEVTGTDPREPLAGSTLGELLMVPTRIYVRPVIAMMKRVQVHAMAHITGGGLIENLPRVLPDGVKAVIDPGSWRRPAVFDWLQRHGGIADLEMWRTFNCGVGLVLCVATPEVQLACSTLNAAGEQAWVLGHIALDERGAQTPARVELIGEHPA